jgi:hypothetical protein
MFEDGERAWRFYLDDHRGTRQSVPLGSKYEAS